MIDIQVLDGGAVAPAASEAAPVYSPTPAPLPCPKGVNCEPCVPGAICNFYQYLSIIPGITETSAELSFTFVPGVIPGSYRVTIRRGTRAMLLEFWAADPNNPQINPPAITAAQPDNF